MYVFKPLNVLNVQQVFALDAARLRSTWRITPRSETRGTAISQHFQRDAREGKEREGAGELHSFFTTRRAGLKSRQKCMKFDHTRAEQPLNHGNHRSGALSGAEEHATDFSCFLLAPWLILAQD